MRILVTGAAGFIGSHVVDRLLARGDLVIGMDNFDPFYSPAEKRSNLAGALANPRFTLLEADITDLAAMDRAFAGPRSDAVVHLAAKVGVRPSLADPVGYERVNVGGTRTVLDAAGRSGVRAFVFASSSSVYGNAARVPFREGDADPSPISPYAATKLAAEAACRDHQARVGGAMICLRFFTAYGPHQRPDLAIRKFVTLMRAGLPIPVFGDGGTERDYTWIEDIVDGVLKAVDRSVEGREEFEIINLGSGRPVRLDELVALLSRTLGVPLLVDRQPMQPGDVARTWADISKAQDLLRWAPQTKLESGIRQFTAKPLT
ncbi:MAG: NAD-dependent epimerase/dehydratase family protein [Gemmatimonadetes bacterium]|nr:NAD-dependent epimerase/dehydratase family protein [Gemmatimonadota bacterium]